ncbi:MAG: C45 family autoproteolytic acyltransferase/hydrolase [Thermomicrobiales bacterium]
MIPLIETGGTWRDIGHDIGKAARDQIQVAAASARAELGGVELAEVVQNIGPYLRATEEAAPDIAAELRGMATGSGVPFETLFVLNAAAELTQALGRMACSVVAVAGSGAADGHVLLAHNEDATAGWGDLAYVVKVAPSNAPPTSPSPTPGSCCTRA